MIICKLMGGLGNQMFQYAAALSVASKHAVPLKLDINYLRDKSPRRFRFCPRDYGLNIFNISAGIASSWDILQFTVPRTMNKYLYHTLYRIYPNRKMYNEDEFALIDIPGDAYMVGYWQYAKILEENEAVLKQEFSLRPGIVDDGIEIADLIQHSINPVCVSFRRGDYVGHPTLGFLTMDYYMEALKCLQQQVPQLTLFVFSDDIPWCEQNFRPNGYHIHYVNQKYTGRFFQNYFYLMMLCKFFIIPNSTYPFWAAYLSRTPQKTVIAPRKWHSAQKEKINAILPSTWLAL